MTLRTKFNGLEKTSASYPSSNTSFLIRTKKLARFRLNLKKQRRSWPSIGSSRKNAKFTKDKDFEMRLRGLRQENEKMKQTYKDRATDPDLAAKYSELEKEL